MNVETNAYSSEKIDRIAQLDMCFALMRKFDEKHEESALGGAIIVTTPGNRVGELFDATKKAVVGGFAHGAFNEAMDMGLQKEVKAVMPTLEW